MYTNFKIDYNIFYFKGNVRICEHRMFLLSSCKYLLQFPLSLIQLRLIILRTIDAIKYSNAP